MTGVSLPRWSDDELLAELGAALQEAPVADEVIAAAQASFAWRTVDADLELLGLAADPGASAAALVRGGGPAQPGTLAFRGDQLGVEIEIDEAGIVGQLDPPRPGQVTLVTTTGPHATAQADQVGCFTFPPPPSGPIRLDCRLGDEHFITEWVTM